MQQNIGIRSVTMEDTQSTMCDYFAHLYGLVEMTLPFSAKGLKMIIHVNNTLQ